MRFYFLLISGIIGVLIINAFIFLKISKNDYYYLSNVQDNFREVQRINNVINENVLQNRITYYVDYDRLSVSLYDLNELNIEMAEFDGFLNNNNKNIVPLVNDLKKLTNEKISFCEEFKSINTVLRNSLVSISVIGDDLKASSISELVRELNSIVFTNQLRDIEDTQEEILRLSDKIEYLAEPEDMKAQMYLNHIRNVYEKLEQVSRLTNNIINSPINGKTIHINKELGILSNTLFANLKKTIFFFIGLNILFLLSLAIVLVRLRKRSQVISDLNNNLEKKIEERTSELTESLEKLNQSYHDLDQFAYIASHDLKTPLRGISTLTTFIEEDLGEVNDEVKEHFNKLRERTDWMNELINDILDYSKAGRTEEKKVDVSVVEIIEQIIAQYHIPEHITINHSQDLPIIYAERVFIYQIFANLISNAIKYNDKEEGLIEINAKTEPDFVTFEIRDNGQGIESKYFEKIFNIFETLQNTKREGSTGVGLSTVKKIIKLLKGEIWVESEVGKGTTFFVKLPMK